MDSAEEMNESSEYAPAAEANPDEALTSSGCAELAQLIQRAFESAQKTRPENWQRMTIAVLKNRLLNLTDRRFTETYYGVRNMRDLVDLFPDLLYVDDSSVPPIVELMDETSPNRRALPSRAHRIRPDLWNSVMDYASGREWVWLDTRATPTDPGESDAPKLPTLSPVDMQAWRDEFANRHRPALEAQEADRLEEWRNGRGRTIDLPSNLRHAWNERLRSGVADRLREWFRANDEDIPLDLFLPTVEPRYHPASGSNADSLRAFVAECVSLMTGDELKALQLPATAVHRYATRRGDHR